MLINQSIVSEIKSIIAQSRENAIRKVDHERTLMYWQIGQRIFEEEQLGKDRAEYGKFLISFVSQELVAEYGSGFSKRYLEIMRQFYRTFPIANALSSQLSWTQYRQLIRLDSDVKLTEMSFLLIRNEKALNKRAF